MSHFQFPSPVNQWAAAFASGSVDKCVAALRQIASAEDVRGVAVSIANLAGHSNEEIRMWAAEALEAAVMPSPAEAPELSELLLRTEDGEVAYWAATLLGRLGHHAACGVMALEKCLSCSMFLPARERAAWALSQIGVAATPAMPALRQAANQGTPRLKRLAIQALEAIRGVAA